MPFKVTESWAGLMPITNDPKSDQKFFFWLWPAMNKESTNDVVIWLNGGPGCSSNEGNLQELGPLNFPWNVTGSPDRPYVEKNPYAWNNLATLLFVEQPISTGFSTGTPTAKNEVDVANQFFGFLEKFYDVFPELHGKNLWITG